MHERITEPDFFKTQIERLRANRNWADSFSDIGLLQLIKNRLRGVPPGVFEAAVSELIAECKYAPVAKEIFDTVARLTPKKTYHDAPDCQRCGWDGIKIEDGKALRCLCPRGAQVTQEMIEKAQYWFYRGQEQFPTGQKLRDAVQGVPLEAGERSRR